MNNELKEKAKAAFKKRFPYARKFLGRYYLAGAEWAWSECNDSAVIKKAALEIEFGAATKAIDLQVNKIEKLQAELDAEKKLSSSYRDKYAEKIEECEGLSKRLNQFQVWGTDECRHCLKSGCRTTLYFNKMGSNLCEGADE